MIENIPKIIPHLPSIKVNNEIVGISISMILNRQREDIAYLGLHLLKNIAKIIGLDLVDRYFYREITEIISEGWLSLKKIIIELIAEIFQCPKGENLKARLVSIFTAFCDDEN